MSPNLDQLQFITTGPTRRNPALYDAPSEPAAPKEKPTIVIGPNAAYIVDPAYLAEKKEEGLPELPDLPEPPELEPPSLTSLEPAELPVWAQDTEVYWNGANFTEVSKIIWNGAEEPTKFIDSGKLSTTVRPSTISVTPPFPLETYVVNGGKESEKLTFTFIA
jgi:hypothetical protein